MPRHFNVAGPCLPDEHYMLPPERRLGEVRPLIERKAFFVVHAPRQTGKTTCFLSLARALNTEGRYAALLVSCKPAAATGDDIERAIATLIRLIDEEARFQLPDELRPPRPPEAFYELEAETRLRIYLSRWCAACAHPVVLFLDEFDALTDAPLLSLLYQLHSGYTARPAPFPYALALIGMRDVRDYRLGAEAGRLGTSSPFNVKLESLLLRDFTAEEIAELYAQHTTDTGQRFEPQAIERVATLSCGQPWLVNALARQAVEQEAPDPSIPITAAHVETAKEKLILRRDTHVDSLIERLREPRVRRVLEPILAGNVPEEEVFHDDIQFVKDLGLVRRGQRGLEIANPIYHEIVPRALAAVTEEYLTIRRDPFITREGVSFSLSCSRASQLSGANTPSISSTANPIPKPPRS